MSKVLKGLLGMSVLLSLTACSDPIESVVKQNLQGLQKQDVDMVMDTIDTHSQHYDNTRAEVTRLLQDYNLDFKIESMSILTKPADEKKEMERASQENQDITGLDAAINSFITEEEQASAEQKKREEAVAASKRPLKAEVKVTQVTRTKSGNAKRFFNNRVTVVHTLHKYPTDDKPQWKIYASDIRAVDLILDDES